MTRRAFLALPLLGGLTPLLRAAAEVETHRAAASARVHLLFGLLRFEATGTIQDAIDRSARRYEVRLEGQGSGITISVASSGILRGDRWAPLRTRSRFVVYGRESRLDVAYDHDRRSIDFKSRQETFLLRRLRVTDDVVPIPEGVHVDDIMSAAVNYADGRWVPGADGALATHVVRRRRGPAEGPDDVEPGYRAEVIPFALRVAADPATGKPTALIDLTPFTSWAREQEPARIVFGPDRRPESISGSLVLGTSVEIGIQAPSPAS